MFMEIRMKSLKSGIDYLNRQKNTEIVKVDSDNKNIYCKQTLNLPSGKELIYDAVYTFYPYPKNLLIQIMN